MTRTSLIVLLMSSLGACSAAGVDMDTSAEPDAGVPEDDITGPVELEVDTPDASTYWSSVPFTGHGPVNGTLVFTTPGGGQFTEELGATGDFCVDVVLQKDTSNTIKFEAISPEGDYSDPVLVDIRQQGEPPNSDPAPDPEPGYSNIASGATIDTMSVSIEDGDVSALVDGDSSGHVSIRNAGTSADWMVIELNQRLPIEQIHIETTTDCPMDRYNILLNDDAQSEDPIVWSWAVGGAYVYGQDWTMVGSVTNGSSDETIVPSIGGPSARRLAIEFLSRDCGPWVGSGRHRITEIEVWAQGEEQPTDEPTNNGAPSCTSTY